MFHLVLYEPEIPPNTGNIIRLCANTGSQLHLIEPLGFELDDTRLRRAGLDYEEYVSVKTWPDLDSFIGTVQPSRLFGLSTKGSRSFFDVAFKKSDAFVFGPETRGLPETLLKQMGGENVLRLPMQRDSRSLNLSNTAAIVIYEAWRQGGFEGGS